MPESSPKISRVSRRFFVSTFAEHKGPLRLRRVTGTPEEIAARNVMRRRRDTAARDVARTLTLVPPIETASEVSQQSQEQVQAAQGAETEPRLPENPAA